MRTSEDERAVVKVVEESLDDPEIRRRRRDVRRRPTDAIIQEHTSKYEGDVTDDV
jgi:hypothetical protein